MSTYLINGPSGTGKTSIGKELAKRGYRVIDTDKAFGYYANLQTEKPVKFPGEDRVSPEWYAINGWIWRKKEVEKVLNEAKEVTFFCGGALNESQFYHRFTQIFRLIIDSETLVNRLSARVGDQHTNNPSFIARMVSFLEHAKSDAEKLGWVVIDTSKKSVEESVEEILAHVDES